MTAGPYRIAVVCLGNICRSPMAHVVLDDRIAEAGLGGRVQVASAGTGDWHVGQPMDRRAAAVLRDAGYDPSRHIARTFTTDWYAENDLLLAMDASNYADMAEQSPTVRDTQRLHLFREFDPEAGPGDDQVPDPWYGSGDGFAEVLTMIERTADGLIERLPELMED